jgi:alpha-N-arabinofuranosidase
MYLITNGSTEVLTEAELAPYVQNVLDELEFILGDTNTHNGALRASLGYPEPWALKYVEIGNEDNLWGGEPSYDAYRWNLFFDAIHEKWPDLTLISSTQDQSVAGPGSAWDYHIYTRPDDFVAKFDYWDHVARNHSILQGEYANIQGNIEGGGGTNWSAPRIPWPIWVGAVSESIWTLGIERNGDVMIGASYAPGFQNLNDYQWQVCLPSQTAISTQFLLIPLKARSRSVHSRSRPNGPLHLLVRHQAPLRLPLRTHRSCNRHLRRQFRARVLCRGRFRRGSVHVQGRDLQCNSQCPL